MVRNIMWQKTYSTTVSDITPQQIWKVWSDIKIRPLWDDDTQWAEINGLFEKGTYFYMKIKNGPKLKMLISDCIPNQSFTDCYRFPLATLYGVHEMHPTPTGLCIKTTMQIKGPLSFIWRKLVVEKIVATLPHQTELLIQLARKNS